MVQGRKGLEPNGGNASKGRREVFTPCGICVGADVQYGGLGSNVIYGVDVAIVLEVAALDSFYNLDLEIGGER